MPSIYNIVDDRDDVKKTITRALQSGHINFLLGAGASQPAIPVAGAVERDIQHLIAAGERERARTAMYEFLRGIHGPVSELLSGARTGPIQATLANYETFLLTLERALTERRTAILPRRATIFTTNYDLFFEKAATQAISAVLNTGFSRVPSLGTDAEFSSQSFFLSTFATGHLYDYRVELPTLNVIKLHGCLSWRTKAEQILLGTAAFAPVPDATDGMAVQQFIDEYSVILPESDKYNATVLNRTYYELLRTFANELDKENVVLFSFGFSFNDEHVYHLMKRGLRNPTLKLFASAYDEAEAQTLTTKFHGHHNVTVLRPEDGGRLDFPAFNALMNESIPAPASWR